MASKEELAMAIDEAEWDWIRAHLERGGVILIDDSLDLADAAYRVAVDDMASVEHWLGTGKLGKPSTQQVALWDADRRKKFSILVISPFVLIQERGPTIH